MDIGQNMAGWVRFRIKGQAGHSIRLRFAESLQSNGELYTRNFRDARSTDVYVVSGRETKMLPGHLVLSIMDFAM
ncbi:family 78 glycoside hydrolase catalytic domain [Bacteroides sp. CR5/BHMF/2]|nr:family 78 glycoside hydrolase catalytic domain [Bacteroides sp. CR5/BHMF/2]